MRPWRRPDAWGAAQRREGSGSRNQTGPIIRTNLPHAWSAPCGAAAYGAPPRRVGSSGPSPTGRLCDGQPGFKGDHAGPCVSFRLRPAPTAVRTADHSHSRCYVAAAIHGYGHVRLASGHSHNYGWPLQARPGPDEASSPT